jgi:predicted amidohydrolase YtcJ
LRGWTNGGAQYLLRWDRLGSLEPDKLADFAVIDKDYFTIPEGEILNIKTLMTVIGGRVVFKDSDY